MTDEENKEKKCAEAIEEVGNATAKLQVECAEYKAGWQRAAADYKNLQKEVTEMRGMWAKMSEEQILRDFIPVYENFKRAWSVERGAWSAEQENWAKGIGHIMKQFAEILKQHGVEEIKTVGEKFDPRWHEAVAEEQAEGKESGIVLKEVEGGYKMVDRVIKPARVIISK